MPAQWPVEPVPSPRAEGWMRSRRGVYCRDAIHRVWMVCITRSSDPFTLIIIKKTKILKNSKIQNMFPHTCNYNIKKQMSKLQRSFILPMKHLWSFSIKKLKKNAFFFKIVIFGSKNGQKYPEIIFFQLFFSVLVKM